jgi:hypothetical protein
MPEFKLRFGKFPFSLRITLEDRTLRYRFARWVLLAEVPVEEIVHTTYVGQGPVLHLRDGRNLKLRGITLDDFAILSGVVDAFKTKPCGANPRADNPPLERTAAAV